MTCQCQKKSFKLLLVSHVFVTNISLVSTQHHYEAYRAFTSILFMLCILRVQSFSRGPNPVSQKNQRDKPNLNTQISAASPCVYLSHMPPLQHCSMSHTVLQSTSLTRLHYWLCASNAKF